MIEPDRAGAFHAGASRAAGLLLPLFSLPSSRSWGIGEFPDLAALARWMQGAGLRMLQLLPANEMATGQSSPYSALSAMALDPIFIAVQDVEDFQALGPNALDGAMRGLRDHARASRGVDYASVRSLKDRALRASFRRFLEQEWPRDTGRARSLKRFIEDEAWWLEDYAIFRAAHQAADGRSWHDWPEEIRNRRRGAMDRLRREHGLDILFRQYLQWIAQSQWQQARDAARGCGVALYGDFPFGVAGDSADTWANQELFSFDGSAGAPPDAFSDEGQNWALPVYRWDVLRESGYAWFAARARRAADLFDGFRVDHVVGLFRTWTFDREGRPACFVPAEEPAQIAQGVAVLRALGASTRNDGHDRSSALVAGGARSALSPEGTKASPYLCIEGRSGRATVLAEDLGTIPDFVREALADLGIPGYKVLRWERHWDEPRQPFIDPVTYPARSLATSGTHDTETLAAWWADLGADDRASLVEVMAASARPSVAAIDRPTDPATDPAADPATDPDTDPATARVIDPEGPFTPALRDALLAALYASGSSLLTLPAQDIFGWTDRINVPGLVDDRNWTWKLPWPVDRLDDEPAARERRATLRAWAEQYGRLP